MINARAQRKLLHTWIILVIVNQRVVQLGPIDGRTEYVLQILAAIGSRLARQITTGSFKTRRFVSKVFRGTISILMQHAIAFWRVRGTNVVRISSINFMLILVGDVACPLQAYRFYIVYRQSPLGPVDPSFRALSVRSDVISSIKILSLGTTVSLLP